MQLHLVYALPRLYHVLYIVVLLKYTFVLYMHGCTIKRIHVYTTIRRLSRLIFQPAAIYEQLCSLREFQTSFLKASFQENPYPSGNTKRMIANNLGLSEKRVYVWFKNQRYRVRQGKGHDTIFTSKYDLT